MRSIPTTRSLRFLVAFAAAWNFIQFEIPVFADDGARFIDLSLLVAPELPCTWPDGFPTFRIDHIQTFGPQGAYNIDTLTIDGNTGTQLDVPPHSVARPELKLPNSGPFGNAFTERIEPWQFCGEACIIDCRDLFDTGVKGFSSLVKKEKIAEWERTHRALRFGDVPLLRSDYTDRYYKPLPEGRRFIAEPVERKTPAWPDPDPGCMEYIASRGVLTMGTDSASMGPLPDMAEPTHYAGLKHGMIWSESATNLGQLPTTGAFYCMLAPKHVGGPYSECRAFAIVGSPLVEKLLESAKNKRVVDLSPAMSIDLPLTWPGKGVGNHRQRYTKGDFLFAKNLQLYHHNHILDSQAGTHLVPPAYALPSSDSAARELPAEIRGWLQEYEAKYGRLGTSDATTEKIPISQTCGRARVIDVASLLGTTDRNRWPASPEITPETIKQYEAKAGVLQAGDVVVFRSGHVDRHLKPLPDGAALMADPLNGKSEGWPALGADAVVYLASKGIQCVATDAPTLGGVDDRSALMTYWALGSRGIAGVEFLNNLDKLPDGAYFLFAAIKIRDCHGGPGRAIALY